MVKTLYNIEINRCEQNEYLVKMFSPFGMMEFEGRLGKVLQSLLWEVLAEGGDLENDF